MMVGQVDNKSIHPQFIIWYAVGDVYGIPWTNMPCDGWAGGEGRVMLYCIDPNKFLTQITGDEFSPCKVPFI
jgi:hypothetical protein